MLDAGFSWKTKAMDGAGPPSRSRFGSFTFLRGTSNRRENQKRQKLTNIYNHLAFSLFANQTASMAESVLLNGQDTDEWTCKGCGQAIWIRTRRKQCYLCARFFHTDCRKQSVILVKPSVDREKMGRPVKCCHECMRSYTAQQAFALFRAAFEERRKVDLLYDVFKQLQVQIPERIQEFGGLVIRFVEEDYVAERKEYAECQVLQGRVAQLFKQLTNLVKRFDETKYDSKREEIVAKNIKVGIVEWVAESLAQLRALEISWKKVQVRAADAQPAKKPAERKPAALGVKVASISPVLLPLAGARIDIFGDNFSPNPGSLQVYVENVECKVESVSAKQVVVLAPPLAEGPKDVRLVQFGSEMLLPKILSYHAPFDDDSDPPPRAPSLERMASRTANVSTSSLSVSPSRTIEEETQREAAVMHDEVSIESLNPVMSPLNGTMIELKGHNIDESCSVLIDGVSCDFVEFLSGRTAESQRLIFLSPRLLDGGFKVVEVRNPDGKRGRLENVLFYSE
jgi:hypothetical protein